MTAGKASALAAGFVGALALGVAIGAAMDYKWPGGSPFGRADTTPVTETQKEKDAVPVATSGTVAKSKATAAKAAARRADADIAAPAPAPAGAVTTVAVDMWEPELREAAKAVLNPGAKIEVAAADFRTAEEFMTVAHAARNTQVPFMVLKHRVLNEQRSLAEAIHESKPELDAKAEAERAREAARDDVVTH